MANPISKFITDRLITPAVQAQLPTVQKDTTAFAVGVWQEQNTDLKHTLGQYPDSNYDLLYAIYRHHADVSACVAIWAGSVTGNGWRIGLMDPTAKPTDAQQKQIDALTLWLKNPNPTKRFSRILYELIAHMAITGDSYLNKVTDSKGKIRELWSIHPATVRIVADIHGDITGYIQRYHGLHVAEFTPEEISRLQLPSVVNDLYGHSPLESVLEEVHTDLQALRSNQAIFENGLAPSAVMRFKEGVSPEKVKQAIDQIRQQHTQAHNRHKIIGAAGIEGLDQWGQSLKDMEFIAIRELTTEKVSTAYRVPKFMLNQKESADLATSAVQERQFYNGTIKPVQDLIAEVLTEEVIHTFSPDLAFYFNEPDFNDADALRRDALLANKQDPRIVDVNELRERYFSLPPRENLPDVMEEQDNRADDAAVTTDPQPSQTTNVREQADLSAEEADPETATEATPAPKAKKPAKKAVHKALSPDEEQLAAQREQDQDNLAQPLIPAMQGYFTNQQHRYTEDLQARDTLLEGDLDQYLNNPQQQDDAALYAILSALLLTVLQAGRSAAEAQTGKPVADERVAQPLRSYIQNDAFTHVQGINDTTRKQLRATLLEGIQAGESIPDLTTRVKTVFTQASDARAALIARTESAQAYQAANHATLQTLFEDGAVTRKRWICSLDERTCPVCLPLDGYTVRFDQPFPGNAEPGSLHIQCRCTSIGLS